MSNILEDTIVNKGCINSVPSGGSLTYSHLNSTVTDTTGSLINSGSTFLHAIIVNTTAAGAITIYDGVGPTTGTAIGVLQASVLPGTFTYNLPLTTGLCVTLATNSDVTVVYKDL